MLDAPSAELVRVSFPARRPPNPSRFRQKPLRIHPNGLLNRMHTPRTASQAGGLRGVGSLSDRIMASGLRLEESTALSWDQDAPFYADLTGKRSLPNLRRGAEKRPG